MRRSPTEPNLKNTVDLELEQLKQRLETLKSKETSKTVPDGDNPFKDFDLNDNEDQITQVIGSFEDNFINNDTIFKKYLNEPLDTLHSTVEANALNSMDIINNNYLKLDLMNYSNEILRQAANLAKHLSGTFNSQISAFTQQEPTYMAEYLKDPIIVLDYQYIAELQSRIFLWLNGLNQEAYDALVQLINSLNAGTVSVDAKIILVFISGLLIPKICRAIENTAFIARDKIKLSKLSLQYMTYNAFIYTPHFRNYILRIDKSQQIERLTQLIEENKQKLSNIGNLRRQSTTNLEATKKQIEEVQKNFINIKKIIGYGIVGIGTLFIAYQIGKFLHDINLANHREKIQIREELRNETRVQKNNKEIAELTKSVKILQDKIAGVNTTKRDLLVNESLFKIALVKFKNAFFEN